MYAFHKSQFTYILITFLQVMHFQDRLYTFLWHLCIFWCIYDKPSAKAAKGYGKNRDAQE